jgi:TetR/AcrR family transcriptional regulator, transcriptional repressor for nem operon
LAQNLVGVLIGIRVLARVRPERALLEGVAAPALALLRVDPIKVNRNNQGDIA